MDIFWREQSGKGDNIYKPRAHLEFLCLLVSLYVLQGVLKPLVLTAQPRLCELGGPEGRIYYLWSFINPAIHPFPLLLEAFPVSCIPMPFLWNIVFKLLLGHLGYTWCYCHCLINVCALLSESLINTCRQVNYATSSFLFMVDTGWCGVKSTSFHHHCVLRVQNDA